MTIVNTIKKRFFKKRELTTNDVYDTVYHGLCLSFEYPYVIDVVFIDGKVSHAIFTADGKYYRTDIIISGDDIALSKDFTELSLQPVEQRSNQQLRVYRNSLTGELNFLSIANSSVLNRDGEIDSTEMYDYMEQNYSTQEERAYLTWYHENSGFAFGEIHRVYRYGDFLIIAGVIDETTLIGKRFESALERSKEPYGISIGFKPLERSVELISGVKTNVYRKGILVEASVLKESHAASYFTEITSIRKKDEQMNKSQLLESLKGFLGEDAEEEITQFLETAEVRQRTIQDKGLITREGDPSDADTKELEALEEAEPVSRETLNTIVTEVSDLVAERLQIKLDEINEQITRMQELEKSLHELPIAKRDNLSVNSAKPVEEAQNDKTTLEDVILNTREIAKSRLEGLK